MLALAIAVNTVSTGLALAPLEVRIGHPPRTAVADYEASFGCPLRFDPLNRYEVTYSAAALAVPNKSPDQRLAEMAEAAVVRQTRQHYKENLSLADLVSATLGDADSVEAWRLESVAAALQLQPRTLQHKLQQEGTNFHRLVDAARRARAVGYLKEGLTQEEVSDRLGYADAGSFRKAFLRWYAQAPNAWLRREKTPPGTPGPPLPDRPR